MLNSKIQAVKDAISSDNVDTINSAVSDLEGSLQALAQAAQSAQAGASAQPDVEPAAEQASNEPKQAKGKVVDAEVVD
jgi:molecular chaperone DnaK